MSAFEGHPEDICSQSVFLSLTRLRHLGAGALDRALHLDDHMLRHSWGATMDVVVWLRSLGLESMQKRSERIMSERENILSALREKPLKVFEIMRRAIISNEESCQSLLLRMRDEGSIKFDIQKGRWSIG
jgi:hypothetical protein